MEEDAFIQETIVKKSPYKKAVSRILSGMKINIPEDLKLMDRFGIKRSKSKVKVVDGFARKALCGLLFITDEAGHF